MGTNRVALVTGGGKQRVGFGVARALGKAGYAIVLHYRSSVSEAAESVRLLGQEGITADAMQADLSDEGQTENLVGRLIDRHGRIDALVTCASRWGRHALAETDAGLLMEQFRANTMTTALACLSVGRRMVAQPEGGAIVTVGDWALRRPYPDHLAYHTSKGAVAAFTRALAVELGRQNPRVRVNMVEPGPVMLPPDMPEDEKQEAIGATLVRKEGNPDDVGMAVLALVENSFITGVSLPVDGGRSIWAGGL
jgi:pteridine reductase